MRLDRNSWKVRNTQQTKTRHTNKCIIKEQDGWQSLPFLFPNVNIFFRSLQLELEFFYIRVGPLPFHMGVKVTSCESN